MLEILSIVGPTASGKTALAIEYALEMDGEIISVDSRQIYRGFVIGTGQPTSEEQKKVPHHLINTLDPAVRITAGHFTELAYQQMAEINGRGRTPILCGGTGLYLRAIRLGLAPLGKTDPALRAKITKRIAEEGADRLYAELAHIDPEYAATFHPHNLQRLTRAWEIIEATGSAPSQLQSWRHSEAGLENTPLITIPGVGSVTFKLVGIERPREDLYQRIDRRVEQMISQGWLEEVQELLESGIPANAPPIQSVGYKEMVQILRGELTLAAALPIIQQRTRQYARRQITWFRREPVHWITPATR
ncbi:tRNA (adenosine(37)-N6)-dimethylallyltransferase MiaA [Candidatus Neomarinimicrobiota bacterium]